MKDYITTVLLLALAATLAACGKAKPMPEFNEAQLAEQLPLDGSNINGKYAINFITLNTAALGFLTTTGHVTRKDDRINVRLKLTGGSPNVWHRQAIHTGWGCPVAKDDLNNDGYIDAKEGAKVWGQPLIPLDADLATQEAGMEDFPIADSKGTYSYGRTTDFKSMFEDLKTPSESDTVAKIPENMGLMLEGKAVVIMGTSKAVPETVAQVDGLSREQSLPIACGLIKKLNVETTEVPEVEEGNLGPARETPTESDDEWDGSVPGETPTPEPDPVPTPAPGPSSDEDDDDWTDRVRESWCRIWGNCDD